MCRFLWTFAAILFVPMISMGSTARDSVAVFHRPEKVVILIHDRSPSGRLQTWMDQWGAENELILESTQKDIKIQCGRKPGLASCTFRLHPSASVRIGEKATTASLLFSDFGSAKALNGFEMSFESSRGHRFEVEISELGLSIHAARP